jgi:Tol biopolymer transport system component/ribosomal protein S25
MTFGKNRVQYEDFNWFYYRYATYDVYFYQGGRELAIYTAKYAKEIIEELEVEVGVTLEDKLQFVLFNNFSDLKQSNIGLLSDQRYNTGGVTHIIGTKVVLYFDGTHSNLEEQIKAGVVQTLINNAIYGTSLGAQIKNNSLFPFPEWFLSGLVSYYSKPWTSDIDDKVRDGITSGRYANFNRLTGEDARWAGHSFWYFISNVYGKENIANILYLAKMSRRVQSGFKYALYKDMKTLIEEWQQYYSDRYREIIQNTNTPQGAKIIKRSKKHTVYQQVKISPDGKYAAYATNQSGLYKIFIKNLKTGKKKKIYKGAYRLNEKVDYSYPVLDWHPSSRILAFVVEKKGKPYMIYYDVKEKKKESIYMSHFEKVLDFSYSDDGYFMAMSAITFGQSDIFVYDVGANSYERLTYDIYDDRYPCFYHHDQSILFCSNRINDTIRKSDPLRPDRVEGAMDLFMYDYKNKNNVLQRVSNTSFGNEIKVQQLNDQAFTYLSDVNGIQNLYLGKLDSTISFVDTTIHYRYFTHTYPLSNFSRNILDYDINDNVMASIFFIDNRYKMLISDIQNMDMLSEEELMKTHLAKQQQEKKEKKQHSKEDNSNTNHLFYNVHQSDLINRILKDIDSSHTINYQHIIAKNVEDSIYQKVIQKYPVKKLLSNQPAVEDIPQRRNYYVEYFINEVTTQLDFTSLYNSYQPFQGGGPIFNGNGINGLFQLGVTDLMEDYRIVGGAMFAMNFKNNEYLLSYSDLKHRIDKEVVFHRKPTLYQNDSVLMRETFNEFFYIWKYPFNEIMSARLTLSYRNESRHILAIDNFSLAGPNMNAHNAGIKGEFVYDNTQDLGINLMQGTRYKFFFEYNQHYQPVLKNKSGNLFVLGFDYRNYQKIHRTFIWANRIAGSTALGNQKLAYFMGGVDNWFFPKYNEYTPIDYSQDYKYQGLATNMRGFPQNIRNGNSFIVLNSELRFPLFNYFSKYPLNSDFLNNFQLIGFGDIGTVWTGLTPYADDNYLYTRYLKHNPLFIKVKMVSDPWVGGFGFGARTKLIGYFMRLDMAWGVENLKIRKPVIYFSLSLDF